MHIEVEGWTDDVERNLIRQFVRHSLRSLVEDDICNNLVIRVVADINLLARNVWAEVVAEDPENHRPTRYVISLARHGLNLLEQLMVLGHELTHVKQFCTGEWRILDFTQHWWQNEVIDSNDLDDWFEPWEVEARGREKGLLERFVRFYKYSDQPWYTPRP